MSSTQLKIESSRGTLRSRKSVDRLILMALGSFAVTGPLLSTLRAGAGYFVARRAEPLEIVLLVLVLTLLPGLVANLFVWAAEGFSERARSIAQTVFVGLFLALTVQTTLTRITPLDWITGTAVSLLSALLGCLAYRRWGLARTYLSYLIPAPLIFAAYFLLTPPVSGLVFPSNAESIGPIDESRVPVVFVIFDELPVVSLLNAAGGIDAARYPNFAALASMSTWYKYTTSAHDNTLWAVPALLTGQLPDPSRLPTAANYPGNLFTLLAESHELHVIEPFTHLCPPELCGSGDPTSFGVRFSSMVADSVRLFGMTLDPSSDSSPAVSDPFNEFMPGNARQAAQQEFATDQLDRFADFVGGIDSPEPTVHFLHLFLPHAPFRYYQSGRQYNDGEELDGLESEVWVEPALAHQAHQRHLLQVQAVDRLIGELLTQLRRLGALEETLLVVSADHGISFRPGEQRRPLTAENAYEIGLVPLFIKAPYQERAEVDTNPRRTIDVLPTVASHLGIDLPWAHEGRTLLEAPPNERLVVMSSVGADISLADVDKGLRDSIDYVQSVFGKDGGSFGLYSIGGYDSLIGMQAGDLDAQTHGLIARVSEDWRFAHVAPYTRFVPGFIHGRLFGRVEENTHVAIALNGVVETVVETYDVDQDTARFNAILPDQAFVAGFNDLEIMVVTGPPERPQVELASLEGNVSFDMETAVTGRVTRLLNSVGESWPIDEESTLVGSIDAASWRSSDVAALTSTDLDLEGWAVNEDGPAPVDRIVFFIDEVYAGTADVDVERPDIQDAYESSEVLVSGFVGRLPQFLPSPNLDVRAFALSGDYAEELPITESALAGLATG